MKNLKRFVCVLAVAVFAVSACVGCRSNSGNGGGDVTIDTSKSQLYVGNYNGGYGSVWLDHLIEGFEEKYKNVSFESGKVGVQIIPDPNKDYIGSTLISTITSKTNDIYFTESADYYAYLDKGYMLDITDIMTTPQADDNNKTIVSKMTDVQKDYYCADGKYYAVPHYAGFSGIMYDIDLFEQENLYFSGEREGKFVTSASETRSAGPDGVTGTSDDGLPATYDEFFSLLDHMVKVKEITPFVFTGQYSTYLNWLLSALYVDYEGADNMNAILNLNGSTVDNIVELEDGKIGSPKSVALTNENGYKLFGTQGKLEVLKFLEKILTNSNYYYNPCVGSTYSNRNAQTDYLKNGVTNTKNRIAFLCEGIWWAEEASEDFVYVVDKKGDAYSQENRNIGILPLPKASADQVGSGSTLIDINKSTAFIYSGIKSSKIELAKTFLAYACTDEALRDFSVTTDCPKALNYDLGDDYNKLSKYGQNVWNTYKNSDYVLHYSDNAIYRNQLPLVEMFKAGFTGSYGLHPSKVLCPVTAGTSKMTAEEVFQQILEYHNAEWWKANMSAYLDA